jgi:glutaredoxin
MSKQVVVYMSPWCYNSKDTQQAFSEWQVPARFINIKDDRAAAARVKGWVGFESVPTVLIAEGEGVEPFEPPAPLAQGASPRGVDRGSMITEANRTQLREWLVKHGMLSAA